MNKNPNPWTAIIALLLLALLVACSSEIEP
jgi:hypothetical protein